MNATSATTLPHARTLVPSRAGLTHYEVVADGLIHTAAVFDIPADEHFVERVALLAFCNGLHLVGRRPALAAEAVVPLGQSLETGRTDAQALSQALGARLEGQQEVFPAARAFFRERFGLEGISFDRLEDAATIRRVVGEAALAGLYRRASLPLPDREARAIPPVRGQD